jgi:hypothetical protein
MTYQVITIVSVIAVVVMYYKMSSSESWRDEDQVSSGRPSYDVSSGIPSYDVSSGRPSYDVSSGRPSYVDQGGMMVSSGGRPSYVDQENWRIPRDEQPPLDFLYDFHPNNSMKFPIYSFL